MKRAFFFFFAVLLFGCSRTPEPPPRAETSKPSASKQITESQAVDLLMSALKQHKVADLHCLSFAAESDPQISKAEKWEFAAREIHNAKCGGDPDVSHVRDRYEVSSSGMVRVYDVVNADFTNL